MFGQRKGVCLRHGEAVEIDRAVRVDHPFRVPGRAGRVAHARGGALVELWPVDDRRTQVEEILIFEDAWRQRGLRHVVDDDKLADGGERLPDGLEEWPDTSADEEYTTEGSQIRCQLHRCGGRGNDSTEAVLMHAPSVPIATGSDRKR